MNTIKIYFSGKIIRVIFEWDSIQTPRWYRTIEDIRSVMYLVFQAREIDLQDIVNMNKIVPIDIEHWLIEQGMKRVEDDMFLFNIRWNTNV